MSALVAQNGQNGMPNGISSGEDGDAPGRKRTNPNSSANINGMANGQLAENEDGTDPAVEELNAVRSREIMSKAVSGVLLILLKWFKLSRESCYASGSKDLTNSPKTFSNTNTSHSSSSMLITYLSSSSTSLIKTLIERSIKGTTAKTLSKSIAFVISPPSEKSQLLLLLPSQFETSTNLTSPASPLLLNLQRR